MLCVSCGASLALLCVILMLWLRLIDQPLSEISPVAVAVGGENWVNHMLIKFLLGCDTCHLDFTGQSKSHGNAWVQQVGDVQPSLSEGVRLGWIAMQSSQTASYLLCGTFASPELCFNLLLGVAGRAKLLSQFLVWWRISKREGYTKPKSLIVSKTACKTV